MTEPASQHNPDGETILTITTEVFVAACVAVWTAGQIAARIWAGTWLPVSLWESPTIVWRLAIDPARPGDAWPPKAATLVPGPIAYYTILAILSVVILTAVSAGWRWHHEHGATTNSDAARWAKPRDLKPLLVRRPQPGRLTLGTVNRKLVATEEQHSVAVIGPAGTGKTTGFAIPALLEWDGPVIATSVKGDLLEHTIAHRRIFGETWVFDPVSSTAEPSAGWSPLHASTDWQGALRILHPISKGARIDPQLPGNLSNRPLRLSNNSYSTGLELRVILSSCI